MNFQKNHLPSLELYHERGEVQYTKAVAAAPLTTVRRQKKEGVPIWHAGQKLCFAAGCTVKYFLENNHDMDM